MSADLTFLHLSDIHFRRGLIGSAHDSDKKVRDELVADLRRMASKFDSIAGIIITGDIAFSGHKTEYQYADSWIRSLAGHLKCPPSSVMVIPGNHDVDRDVVRSRNGLVVKLQRKVRRGRQPDATLHRLATAFAQKDGKVLASPIKAYNAFAKQFQCDVSVANPFWERRFLLGDGSQLLFRGLTSTWLSGPEDSDKVAKLLYGRAQYTFDTVEKTYRAVAAHHPPESMIDGQYAADAFDRHCKLQLFGHRHVQWTTHMKECVRLAAGALHPDRREKPWLPRYNILEISGELLPKARSISIRIFPRRWSDEYVQFMADFTPTAEDFRLFEFRA